MSNRLLRRLQKHIATSNFSQSDKTTQQDWIKDAVIEKMQKDTGLSDSLKMTHVSLRLDQALIEEMNEKIQTLRSTNQEGSGGSYSRKSWLIEAIEEKLEKELTSTTSHLPH